MQLLGRVLFLYTYNNYEFLAYEPDKYFLSRLNTKLLQKYLLHASFQDSILPPLKLR